MNTVYDGDGDDDDDSNNDHDSANQEDSEDEAIPRYTARPGLPPFGTH
jgi:hypothetical protein